MGQIPPGLVETNAAALGSETYRLLILGGGDAQEIVFTHVVSDAVQVYPSERQACADGSSD
jgi:hypothetical protein